MQWQNSSVSDAGFRPLFDLHHEDYDDYYTDSVHSQSFTAAADTAASSVSPAMEFTKLDFSRLRVYGGTKELKLLREAYLRTSVGLGSAEICLIHGYSGTGKSTLVQNQFVVDSTNHKNQNHVPRSSIIGEKKGAPRPFFVSGKFDQFRGTKPYSALSAAFSELCQLVLDFDDEHHSNHDAPGAPSLIEKVREAVGKTGANVLVSIVPGAQALFADTGFLPEDNSNHASNSEDKPNDTTTNTTATNTNTTLGSKEALQQLKFVVRTFLRSICSPQHPVVLFLDDLQWIDSASLELLKALWTDSEARFFLFVGAYRDNEVTDVHPLMRSLRKLQQTATEAPYNNNNDNHTITITQIKLGNLKKNDIVHLISDLLKVEQLLAESLAEIVYRRTHGNVFFCLEFLKMLHQEGLLCFSISKFIWEWNVNQILEATNAADNVVDLIVGNFNKKLSPTCQNLLKLASCLDNTFHSLVLWQIVKEQQDIDYGGDSTKSIPSTANITSSTIVGLATDVGSMEALEELLDVALLEGIIEKSPEPNWYKFTHNRFQQAAYALLEDDKEEREALHYRIGRVLLPKRSSSTRQEKEWRTFVAVDQLNKGASCVVDEAERIKMAQQNLKAGHMAARMSAYVPAMDYFSAGVKFLPKEGKWDRHYHLCLDLYSSRGEVAYVVADFEETDRMCEEVLKHAKDGMDKMRAAFTRVDSLGAQQKPEECLKLGFEILRKTLDEPFPRKINAFHLIRSLMKTQRMIRAMSDGELLSLPEMTNKPKKAAMKLLTSISTQAYWLQKPEMLALVNFRMMQLSVKYGVARLSPAAFARYGLLLCAIKGDIKEGFRFGKLAMMLVDRLDAREWESQVVCIANQFLFHWQEPLQNLMESLLKAYKLGYELGDVEYSLLSAGGYSLCYFHSGLKLGPMVKDLAGFCSQMKEYGQITSLYATLPYWQGILNLMGEADDPLTLTGVAMDETEVLRIASETSNATCLQNMWFFKSQLAYFLGEFELSLELATKFRKTSESVQAHVIFPSFVFYSGLIHLALAKKTNKRKYFAGARKDINTLKGWVRGGAVNSYHKLRLLEAQYMALLRGKKWVAVKAEFENAINAAARAGFLQDCATAHQLLGEYFLSKNIEFDAKSHLSRAHALFSEWGAMAVANHVQSVHSDTLTADATSVSHSSGTEMKARSRFSSIVSSWRSNGSKSELLSKALTSDDRQSLVRSLVQEAPGNRNLSSRKLGLGAPLGERESDAKCTSVSVLRKVPEVNFPTDETLG